MNIKNVNWTIILIIANLIAVNLVVILFLNMRYPMLGSDYRLAIPAMLDNVLHFRNNGLTIQWYTPSFGGGVPVFPDPNNAQFSLLEILPLWMDPWQAVNLSTVIYISVGFLASYRIFKKVLKLSWQSSILGTIFFSANGFMMQRIAMGHLGYQPFPLLAIVILLFFETAIPSGIAGLLIGLVITLLIHQAGYFLVVVFSISSLMVFPLFYLFQPSTFSWKRITTILVTGGVIALFISASKLSAVYSFMRFFPRQIADSYSVNMFQGIFGIVMQLLGTMNLFPLFSIAKIDPIFLPNYMAAITGADYGYWEFDMSLSPVVFGILIGGLKQVLHTRQKYIVSYSHGKKGVAFLLFLLFIWLGIEFTLAKGWFYPFLRQLPILSSMHVNARFAAAFLFPMAALAAVIYNSWSTKWEQKNSTILFILVNILTLLPLSSYFMIKNDLQERTYDITESKSIYQSIRAGKKFKITAISDGKTNTQAFEKGLSNLNFYDPIFGYALENFHPEIKVGSIWDISDGYYNMTNPSGYVFPESNNTRPFERIRIKDQAKLDAFAKHNQVEWEIPFYQKVFNWVSLSTFVMSIVFLVIYSLARWRRVKT